MYLPDGRMFLVGTVGYQGVPCVSGSDFVGNLINGTSAGISGG